MTALENLLLEIKDLHVTFHLKEGDVMAVRGVDIQARRGKSLGIVGESGSGKSVTSLAIMRLIKEPPGKVKMASYSFDGLLPLQMKQREMRTIRGKQISMIFQEPMTSFDPVFTIGHQLIETITLHQKIGKREAKSIAVEMLQKVRIPRANQILGAYPHELSGGMRQRAMIAMALSCKPKMLIADEPTTALDVTIQAQVLKLIKVLQEELGMALIMITHDLGVIAETVDDLVVMYGGKIMEQGSVFDVFENSAHPYTRALLKSIPSIHDDRSKTLFAIKGSPPNPMNPLPGCPFHPRCSQIMDRCKLEFPPLKAISQTHHAFCWRLI